MTVAWMAGVAIWLALYEVSRARGVGRNHWPLRRRACWWLAGGLLVGVWLLAPLAERDRVLWAETLQFGMLAFGVAPLAVLASPFELLGRPGSHRTKPPTKLAPGGRLEGVPAVLSFMAVTIGWRLPVLVDAVAHHPPLLALEAATLVAGTWPLWEAIAVAPRRRAIEHRPRRIGLAAVSAWSVWIFAYVVGFSGRPFYPAFARGVTPVAAQEWAVVVLWSTSAAALVPTIFMNLARWLASDRMVADAETALYREYLRSARAADARPAREVEREHRDGG